MSATEQLRPSASFENLNTSLANVETLMFEALNLDAGFKTTNQIDARSAAAYHLQSGGQRVRARLALASGFAVGLSESDSACIASCAELLHNASLIHDDIQDRDSLRRGQPAIWSKYGVNLAICSGDYLLSAAYGVLCTFSKPLLLPSMLALLHERTATAIDGQCADLSMQVDQPDGIDQYLKIAKAKSGALLSLPLELSLLASGRVNAVPLARTACENFAVSYQIYDDLQDVKNDSKPDSINADEPKNLNIVSIFSKSNSIVNETALAGAEELARDLGIQYLAQCEVKASQMPNGTGAMLIELSSELRRMFDAFSSTERC